MTTQIDDDVETVTFAVGDSTIQIVNDRLLIWNGSIMDKPDVDIDRDLLERMLSMSKFLVKK